LTLCLQVLLALSLFYHLRHVDGDSAALLVRHLPTFFLNNSFHLGLIYNISNINTLWHVDCLALLLNLLNIFNLALYVRNGLAVLLGDGLALLLRHCRALLLCNSIIPEQKKAI
jgi:hypothetical protein